MRHILFASAAMIGMALAAPASASLNVLSTYTGQVNVSTDGCGSAGQACTLTANVPAGGIVQAAFLYTTTFNDLVGAGGTFSGNAVNYTPLGTNQGFLAAGRVDVTATVAGAINGGPGGAYNFAYTEASGGQDGGALVVVYSNPSLPTSTVAILDGFSASTGDSAFLNFGAPLSPSAPGFRAEMRLGIGYSFDGANPAAPDRSTQVSRVTVNGLQLTNVAGHCDDANESCTDGNLITVGDDADPFSVVLPTIADDHEKYDLKTLIGEGDTQIAIRTLNPSNDDNIFLAVFAVTGEAQVTTTSTPEPLSMAMFGTGLMGLWLLRRRRR